ncbi:lipid A deacylase LpxR family protein [Marinobacter sp. V034]|uniref:lipid A deacylase LpxR family protein n=1 Tax=Marinobacter sp. V034 TaxID=3459610 RepID=UPI0040449F2E
MSQSSSALRAGIFFFLVGAHTVQADTLNLSWDNDLLAASDKGYTNGLRFSYLTEAASGGPDRCHLCLADHASEGLAWLPGIGDVGNHHGVAFSLSQLMFTPENIEATTPQYDDTPYAGYLSGVAMLWSWNDRSITGYGLIVGVVGPESGAENAQKWAHKLTGSDNPKGWDNQLGNDAIGGIQALHAERLLRATSADDFTSEITWGTGVRLSNFITNAELGVAWRIGTHLPHNFIPDYSGASSTIGLPGATDATAAGWSLFAGLGTEWVPYSYLDDRSGPYTFEQRPFVGYAGIGVGWHFPGFQAAFTLKASTSPDKTSKEALRFGTLSANWQL